MQFQCLRKSAISSARLGVFETAHGNVTTPVFMPIATRGAVKNLSADELVSLHTELLLSNTYHLYLRPGMKILEQTGGLHRFINWSKPMLTDSGGFQVFSLSGRRKIHQEGVEFWSHIDGSKHWFTPKSVIQSQRIIGSDIMMCLDECPSGQAQYQHIRSASRMTLDWAKQCQSAFVSIAPYYGFPQYLFAIVQGGRFLRLRRKNAEELIKMDFDGYAIGGVSVGESRAIVEKVVRFTAPLLPWEKPRYLMGMGKPEEIVMAARAGVDMFDCVIPTREARHGRLYAFCEEKEQGAILLFADVFYRTLTISNQQYQTDYSALQPHSSLPLLQQTSKAYARHLFSVGESLAYRIFTLHNVEFYQELMKKIQTAIKDELI